MCAAFPKLWPRSFPKGLGSVPRQKGGHLDQGVLSTRRPRWGPPGPWARERGFLACRRVSPALAGQPSGQGGGAEGQSSDPWLWSQRAMLGTSGSDYSLTQLISRWQEVRPGRRGRRVTLERRAGFTSLTHTGSAATNKQRSALKAKLRAPKHKHATDTLQPRQVLAGEAPWP